MNETTPVVVGHRGGSGYLHPRSFRSDAHRLASSHGGDPAREYVQFYALGIDGRYSDCPDAAVSARDAFAERRRRGSEAAPPGPPS
jgi:glycerophosphoryl diester phosphodiesterase